jgi:hypothetical protein
MVRLQYS